MNSRPPVVYGYHGTSAKCARSILRDGFSPSKNGYDWLGDGTYFFHDAPDRAQKWALKHHPDDPAVVVSRITLEDTMDLIDSQWWDGLRESYSSYVTRVGVPVTQKPGGAHRVDRAVINLCIDLLAKKGMRIRAVRGAFMEGEPLFETSALYEFSHVQVAVRDNSLINESALWTW